jgi:hypothetical protein
MHGTTNRHPVIRMKLIPTAYRIFYWIGPQFCLDSRALVCLLYIRALVRMCKFLNITCNNDTPYLRWNLKNINHVSKVLTLHLGVFLNGTRITELSMNVHSWTSILLSPQHSTLISALKFARKQNCCGHSFYTINIGDDYPLRIVKGILCAHARAHTHTQNYCIGCYYIGLLF